MQNTYNKPKKIHFDNEGRPLCRQVTCFLPPETTKVIALVTCKICDNKFYKGMSEKTVKKSRK